jgi:hypothetical protein
MTTTVIQQADTRLKAITSIAYDLLCLSPDERRLHVEAAMSWVEGLPQHIRATPSGPQPGPLSIVPPPAEP